MKFISQPHNTFYSVCNCLSYGCYCWLSWFYCCFVVAVVVGIAYSTHGVVVAGIVVLRLLD